MRSAARFVPPCISGRVGFAASLYSRDVPKYGEERHIRVLTYFGGIDRISQCYGSQGKQAILLANDCKLHDISKNNAPNLSRIITELLPMVNVH